MPHVNLTDSHCHLIFDNFQQDLEQVAQRWREAGVQRILHACVDLSEIPKLKKMADRFAEVYYSVGLHPLDAEKWNADSKNILKKAVKKDKRILAIGELGLDFFKNNDLETQMNALLPQFSLAIEVDLPVIIHCRDAASEMISLCKQLAKENICPKGVMHCWSGSSEEMHEFLDLGFYISFSGIVTFPKAKQTHECARLVPRDKYLIETDAPFLAPVPYRGKRNEPAFVESVAKSIASIRATKIEQVAYESSQNAEDLFKFNLVK